MSEVFKVVFGSDIFETSLSSFLGHDLPLNLDIVLTNIPY